MNYLLDPAMVAGMADLKWVQAMVAGVEESEAALAGRDSIHSWICDNYMIGGNGPGECLHKTPQRPFEV